MVSQVGSVDYVKNPDMVSFTVGRLVCAKVAGGREVSLAALISRLRRIESGESNHSSEGVSPEMAAAALAHLLASSPKAA